MAEASLGVDVVVDSVDDTNTPHCPHGPTLLFERYLACDGGVRRFYACSACRDRRDCPFFQWADEKISTARLKARQQMNQSQQPQFTHKAYRKRMLEFKRLPLESRTFCISCGLVLLPDELADHQSHDLRSKVTRKQLITPTHLLQPLENNKKNAQYLFSEKSTDFIISTLERLSCTRVLCIGVPRLHEAIMKRKTDDCSTMDSLLLDIDHRLEQFYRPQSFCRYNMFNHYFFDGPKSREVYEGFLKAGDTDSLILVMDPPFGGLVEILAHTIKKICSECCSIQKGDTKMGVMWFFPYFMEQRICSSLDAFSMLDYKVNYDNHDVFRGDSRGSKHGSPVRIFTNIEASRMVLPEDEGYRFCEPCRRYVSRENIHCERCCACTSKDGRRYVHCDKCERCVKPSRIHCDVCQQCDLPSHTCGQVKTAGCHICGQLGHKRRECPNKSEQRSKPGKRKNKGGEGRRLKTKKTKNN